MDLNTRKSAGCDLYHSSLNGAGMRWFASVFVAYLGLISGVFVVIALLSAFVIRLCPPRARIAVRLARGSLMLGWAARRG